jgi:hypothetical protein
MKAALGSLSASVRAVSSVDVAIVPVDSLGPGILAVQVEMDRLKIVQAHWARAADEHRIWEASGHRDMASWLAAKAKTTKRTARGVAALGAALAKHGAVGDAADAGDLSAETAGAVAPVLDREHSGDEADLVEAVKGATPADARAAASRFIELNPPADHTAQDRENDLRAKRFLAFPDNPDGTHSVIGNLPASDARTVETALASIAGKPCLGDDRSYGQRLADALVQLCGAYSRGEVKGGRSNLPTVLVVIDVNDLNGTANATGNGHGNWPGNGHGNGHGNWPGNGPGNGPGYTSRGDVISAEAVRRLVWNTDIARVVMNGSVPLDLGRSARLASNDQWRALVVRDGGCRMADCQIPAEWCQVDHIREWDAEHGPTDLDVLVLWCVFHHGFRHRKDVTLIGDANDLSIRLPDGTIIPLPPRGPTHRHKSKPQNPIPTRSPTGTPEPGHQPDLFDAPAA